MTGREGFIFVLGLAIALLIGYALEQRHISFHHNGDNKVPTPNPSGGGNGDGSGDGNGDAKPVEDTPSNSDVPVSNGLDIVKAS